MKRRALRRRYGRASRHPIVYWVRSVGPGSAKDRVAMYYKGVLRRNSDEGSAGDVRARPVSLGDGPYTAVYGRYDFEWENGKPLFTAPHRSR